MASRDREFPCPSYPNKCDKKFNTKEELQEHLRQVEQMKKILLER